MIVGATQTLNAAALPRTAMQRLSYSSSNSDVVSVSPHGILTAQALGSAEITITSVTNPDIRTSVTITVYENPLTNVRANIENGRFRIKNTWLKKWVCTASSGTASSLHMASDTSNYEDTFDFTEVDGYYAIFLTTSYGTFYIGENPGQDPSALMHTVMMPRITSLCMVPDCCLWEIFETDSGEYSFRNVESQHFLYSTGGVLQTAKLGAILGNPAMYPCFWNILNAASNELYMPLNLNQKYSGINDPYVADWGCCLCCVGDVLSYYAPEHDDYPNGYSVNDLIDRGWWKHVTDYGELSYWPNLISWSGYINAPSDIDEFYSVVKSEIDSGHPVVIHCFNNDNKHQHWTVAYKYINNCQSLEDIFVLDPANYAEPNNPTGLFISLKESIDRYDYKEVVGYKTTASKN